jgi:hypothetical protein
MDSCDRVQAALTAGRAPYDDRAQAWLARLASAPSGVHGLRDPAGGPALGATGADP